MIPKSFLLFGALMLAPVTALAIEYPLPQLVGEYGDPYDAITVLIDLGGGVEGVSSASLELSGAIMPGWVAADGDTTSWGGSFGASFLEADPGFWVAGTPVELEGEFTATIVFNSLFGATWDFLSDGIATLTFSFEPASLVGIVDLGPAPTGSLASATLVLDGAVSGEPVSWSRVKALYQ